jgi:hypothetical protein
MAYDKVVDSSVLNANLTAIANAIREKVESTGSISFPAGFVEAIAAIGGLPGGISAMTAGEYTATSDTTDVVSVSHGLGVNPNITIAVLKDAVGGQLASSTVIEVALRKPMNNKGAYVFGLYISSTGGITSSYVGYNAFILENGKVNLNRNKEILTAGSTYFWIAAVIDGVV